VEIYTPRASTANPAEKRQGENNQIHLLAKSCCGMLLERRCVSEKGTQQNILRHVNDWNRFLFTKEQIRGVFFSPAQEIVCS
jgi:hypothetical protein